MMDSAGRKDGRGMFALAGAVVVLVLAAPCTGWAAAGLTQVFTHDPRTVVRATLAAVWCAELVLFAVLAALLVRRRIGVLRSAGVSSQECAAQEPVYPDRGVLGGGVGLRLFQGVSFAGTWQTVPGVGSPACLV